MFIEKYVLFVFTNYHIFDEPIVKWVIIDYIYSVFVVDVDVDDDIEC